MSIPLTLDAILPILDGKMIALFGDLSTRRNQIIKQFILDGFENDGVTCIVTLIQSANNLIEELSNYSPEAGMIVNDAILNQNIQIVDMYSFRGADKLDEEIPGVHNLPSARDLTLLSIRLNEISKTNEKCRFIIWPYSLLTVYTNPKDLINFTQTLAARLSSRNQSGLLVADAGVVPSDQRATIESIVDSIIETRKEEENGEIKEWFRIKFFKGEENHQFDVWTLIR
ncbi:MAG: hypothetical protein INQ03_18330 [Candidatus Heimdallarchaeota archaeon]|nr:hypothetical protein [Candidatus Heimdallarchaeota archaeon]